MNIADLSLAEIVTTKPQAAALLEKYNLDFCCRGKQKLSEQLNDPDKLNELIKQLELVFSLAPGKETDFNKMTLSSLVDHILNEHHQYVKESLPVIIEHLEKVVSRHGDRFQYMKDVLNLFSEVRRDLEQHMMKEEVILFPRIKEIERAVENGIVYEISSITAPVSVMEAEHEYAGRLLDEIKKATSNYSAPEDACITFRVCLDELNLF